MVVKQRALLVGNVPRPTQQQSPLLHAFLNDQPLGKPTQDEVDAAVRWCLDNKTPGLLDGVVWDLRNSGCDLPVVITVSPATFPILDLLSPWNIDCKLVVELPQQMQPEECDALRVFLRNPSLREVDVSVSGEAKSAMPVIEALAKNPQIESVRIEFARVTEDDPQLLLAPLAGHPIKRLSVCVPLGETMSRRGDLMVGSFIRRCGSSGFPPSLEIVSTTGEPLDAHLVMALLGGPGLVKLVCPPPASESGDDNETIADAAVSNPTLESVEFAATGPGADPREIENLNASLMQAMHRKAGHSIVGASQFHQPHAQLPQPADEATLEVSGNEGLMAVADRLASSDSDVATLKWTWEKGRPREATSAMCGAIAKNESLREIVVVVPPTYKKPRLAKLCNAIAANPRIRCVTFDFGTAIPSVIDLDALGSRRLDKLRISIALQPGPQSSGRHFLRGLILSCWDKSNTSPAQLEILTTGANGIDLDEALALAGAPGVQHVTCPWLETTPSTSDAVTLVNTAIANPGLKTFQFQLPADASAQRKAAESLNALFDERLSLMSALMSDRRMVIEGRESWLGPMLAPTPEQSDLLCAFLQGEPLPPLTPERVANAVNWCVANNTMGLLAALGYHCQEGLGQQLRVIIDVASLPAPTERARHSITPFVPKYDWQTAEDKPKHSVSGAAVARALDGVAWYRIPCELRLASGTLDQIHALAEFLKSPGCTATNLYLQEQYFPTRSVAEVIASNNSLRHITLDVYMTSDELCEAIAQKPNIESVHLEFNKSTLRYSEFLAPLFERRLQHVKISGEQCDFVRHDTRFDGIVKMPPVHMEIVATNRWRHGFQVSQLTDLLRKGPGLVSLVFPYVLFMTQDEVDEIAQLAVNHETLQTLRMGQPPRQYASTTYGNLDGAKRDIAQLEVATVSTKRINAYLAGALTRKSGLATVKAKNTMSLMLEGFSDPMEFTQTTFIHGAPHPSGYIAGTTRRGLPREILNHIASFLADDSISGRLRSSMNIGLKLAVNKEIAIGAARMTLTDIRDRIFDLAVGALQRRTAPSDFAGSVSSLMLAIHFSLSAADFDAALGAAIQHAREMGRTFDECGLRSLFAAVRADGLRTGWIAGQ